MLAPPTKYNLYFKKKLYFRPKKKYVSHIVYIKMVKNISEKFLEISDFYNEQLLTHKKWQPLQPNLTDNYVLSL